MVAVIKTSASLHRVFNYNENKVKQGVASCIAAVNYPKDLDDLTLSNKLNRLVHVAALRENVQRKAVHISLNFHPSEKFSHEKLQVIASSYMNKIGFADQPYLVYEHTDAGHPHIHIVSVKVDDSGKAIKTNNIGRNESSLARLQIEQDFGLVPAQGHHSDQLYELGAVDAKIVEYGKGATKQAIANVLEKVLDRYNFTSLHELNAVLKLYNVTADRGKEEGIVYKNKGLYYRVLDQQSGQMTGVPIKASDFHFKPTLANLEKRYLPNKERIESYQKKRIRNAVELILHKPSMVSLDELMLELKKQGIATVLRQKKPSSLIYGLTFVDHQTKLVINGSDLGKGYSASAILQRCRPLDEHQSSVIPLQQPQDKSIEFLRTLDQIFPPGDSAPSFITTPEVAGDSSPGQSLLEILMEPESLQEFIPAHLRLGRKKRRKNRFNNN